MTRTEPRMTTVGQPGRFPVRAIIFLWRWLVRMAAWLAKCPPRHQPG